MKQRCGLFSFKTASICTGTLLILGLSSVSASAQLAASPAPTISPVTTPQASQSDVAAREVAAFARAWAGITGYSATVTVFDQKGTQTQNLVFDYTFRKPSNVTVHVVAGPNAGVTLTWDGGQTVVVHRARDSPRCSRRRFRCTIRS